MILDYSKIENIKLSDINHSDYPDYSDAYILSADYNGQPMTEKQLDKLNDEGFVNEYILNN